jgi:hypothetical protein
LRKANTVTSVDADVPLETGRSIRRTLIALTDCDKVEDMVEQFDCNISKVFSPGNRHDIFKFFHRCAEKLSTASIGHMFIVLGDTKTADGVQITEDMCTGWSANAPGYCWVLVTGDSWQSTSLPYQFKLQKGKTYRKQVAHGSEAKGHVTRLRFPKSSLDDVLSWFALLKFRCSILDVMKVWGSRVKVESTCRTLKLSQTYFGFG